MLSEMIPQIAREYPTFPRSTFLREGPKSGSTIPAASDGRSAPSRRWRRAARRRPRRTAAGGCPIDGHMCCTPQLYIEDPHLFMYGINLAIWVVCMDHNLHKPLIIRDAHPSVATDKFGWSLYCIQQLWFYIFLQLELRPLK